jgi:hypothetical protein
MIGVFACYKDQVNLGFDYFLGTYLDAFGDNILIIII